MPDDQEDDLSPLGPLSCGHRGCPSEARWRPLVLVFLLKQVFGLPSPLGLRPKLRQFYLCDRHRKDVRQSEIVGEEEIEWVTSTARLCGCSFSIDRSQTRLEWEEL